VIEPATLRDVTFIAANMRSEDWAEIACQISAEVTPTHVAAWSLSGREAWVAHWHDQPVAAFGIHNATPAGNVVTVWAWGTRRMRRVVPEMTRFVADAVPRWIEEGITRVEARSIYGHVEAHRWMRGLGAHEQPCPAWGKHGEDFILFSWTEEAWLTRAQ
jgi:hypothetical protein